MKIGNLKDGAEFKITQKSGAVIYSLQSKAKKKAIYTSKSSGKTFRADLNKVVYPVENSKNLRSGKIYGTSGYEPSGC